jgi:hypothetical protein
VTTNVPPEGDEFAGQEKVTPPQRPKPKTQRELPKAEPGMTFWELGGDEDWLLVAKVMPWPVTVGGLSKLSVTVGQSATPFKGAIAYRFAKEETSSDPWIEMKPIEQATSETVATFDADIKPPEGRTFVQIKVTRPGEGKTIELTDWTVTVP